MSHINPQPRAWCLEKISSCGYTIFRAAPVAQLVVRLIRNEEVGGSSPSWGTNISSEIVSADAALNKGRCATVRVGRNRRLKAGVWSRL